MKIYYSYNKFRVIGFLFSVFLIICLAYAYAYAYGWSSGGNVVTSTERVSKLFEKTRLACFGRFVITLPETANIVYGPVILDGNFSTYLNQAENIEMVVLSRVAESQRERSKLPDYARLDLPLIGKVYDGSLPGQKIVFGAVESIWYTLHSYMPVGKNLFVWSLDRVRPEEDKIPVLNTFASKIRSRHENEIPAGAGLCVEGGFLDFDPEFEHTAIGLQFKEFPDVRFSVQMRKNDQYLQEDGSPKLLRERAKNRASAAERIGFFARIAMLRDGRRQLEGWDGEESLTRLPAYKEDTSVHEFRFFSPGLRSDALHPLLDVRLDSGVVENARAKARPSLTDEEAVDLWDRLLPSVRVRKPSDASPSMTSAPDVPLGAVVKTGDICPQSGQWECLERRSIQGERRRFFKTGDKLPPVIATGGTSLWRTLIGDVYDVATVQWKLVDYETAGPVASTDKQEQNSHDTKDNHA